MKQWWESTVRKWYRNGKARENEAVEQEPEFPVRVNCLQREGEK